MCHPSFFSTALAMMGSPYTAGMTPGSPPNSIPITINSSFTYQNGVGGDSMGPNYSPPSGISPTGSPTGTPVNGYTQVRPHPLWAWQSAIPSDPSLWTPL